MNHCGLWLISGAACLLLACSGDGDRSSSYTISISASGSIDPIKYAGSYQFFVDDQRVTRDLSGRGAHMVSFDADRLVFVRVHGNDPRSFYSLSITRDGKPLYESRALPANQPLIHHVPPTQD